MRPWPSNSAAKAAAERGIGGGFVCRAPKAREFRVVAQFLVGERQLRMDLRTARIAGKSLQLFEPRAAPLEEIVVRPAIGAGAIAALGLGMFHQRLGLEILVAVRHEPAINLSASRFG